MADRVGDSSTAAPQGQHLPAVAPKPHRAWNIGVGVDWTRAEAALLTNELSSLLGGKSPKTESHLRITLFSEWMRGPPAWHASAFQLALTFGYRKVRLDSVTLQEVNDSLFPGLAGLINDALEQADELPAVSELRERGAAVVDNPISSAVHVAETYLDLGGTWLEKTPRIYFGEDAACNLFEFGIGMAAHLSGLAVRTEKGGHRGTAMAVGWGGQLAISLAVLSVESPASGWMFKPLVGEARLASVFAGGEFFAVFASAAVSVQLARYF